VALDRYLERPPPPALAHIVACTWQSENTATLSKRVVPDGSADILCVEGRAPFVVGPASRPHVVTLAAGTRIVGVRLRAEATSALGGPRALDASELLDREVPLDALWPAARVRSIAQALADDPSRGLAALVSMLGRRAPDPVVQHAVRWLALHPSGRVTELARALGSSERQLRRRVASASGYAPKVLQRVMRLQRLLSLGEALARAASDAGYVDQAHMTREVGALAGATPRVLRETETLTPAMADFFKSLAGSRDIVGG
jgi:AraC-like DNA-binding protein